MENNGIKHILFVVAMKSEAKPLIETLGMLALKSAMIDRDLAAELYQSRTQNTILTLIHNTSCARFGVPRIGAHAATLLTWEGIKAFSPDLIINIGTAGGFKNTCQISDIFISTQVNYHDRLLEPAEAAYVDYGIGYFNSENMTRYLTGTTIKPGTISSGNALLPSEAEIKTMKQLGTVAKDMEAAAVAEVAFLKRIPFVAIKVISDFIDDKTPVPEQFRNNFYLAMTALSKNITIFVANLLLLSTK